jgi:hypothetical protein
MSVFQVIAVLLTGAPECGLRSNIAPGNVELSAFRWRIANQP